MKGLIVDNFAGGGGASTGIEAALGRPVDIAVDHSAAAVAVHEANHPATTHYHQDVWEVHPRLVCGRRPVELAWFSPDCTHFSRAKGGKPRSKRVRSLAWVVVRWASLVRPRVIILENVEEFETWGPLRDDGQPCPRRRGETFEEWKAQLELLGYRVEHRSLVAADYGAPTTRKRLFLVARCDGEEIVWPEPTHGEGCAQPWRTAAECIDWSIPVPSIFERRRPLADATPRRIAAGLQRYVAEAAEQFIVTMRGTSDTVVASGQKHGLVAAWLTKHYTGVVGQPLARTLGTVTAKDHHALTTATLARHDHSDEVRAFLIKYYGSGGGQSLTRPLGTVTSRDRFGLVTVRGEQYRIVDIGMRMLQPRELFRAQGFPDDYEISPMLDGKLLTKTAQVALAGNSVCPPVATALVRSVMGLGRESVAGPGMRDEAGSKLDVDVDAYGNAFVREA